MHIQWTGSLRGLLAALVALFLLGCEEAADAGKTAEAPAEVGVIVARHHQRAARTPGSVPPG